MNKRPAKTQPFFFNHKTDQTETGRPAGSTARVCCGTLRCPGTQRGGRPLRKRTAVARPALRPWAPPLLGSRGGGAFRHAGGTVLVSMARDTSLAADCHRRAGLRLATDLLFDDSRSGRRVLSGEGHAACRFTHVGVERVAGRAEATRPRSFRRRRLVRHGRGGADVLPRERRTDARPWDAASPFPAGSHGRGLPPSLFPSSRPYRFVLKTHWYFLFRALFSYL